MPEDAQIVTLSVEVCRWLCRVGAAALCFLTSCSPLFAAHSCRAEDTSAPMLGVLAPVSVEARAKVPRDGLWPAPQSTLVCPDTLLVLDPKKKPLLRATGEPQPGQFSWRPEGIVEFSAEDAGRRVAVRYEYAPRRAAIRDAVTPTDYPDVAPLLRQALAEELSRRGLVIVPAQEVADAAAAVALGPASTVALPSPDKLAALAQRVNAAYVVVPGIAVAHSTGPATLDTGIELPRDEVGERHPRNPLAEEPTLVLPVTRHSLSAAVRLTVIDGTTGAVATDQEKSDSQRVRFRRFSHARRVLVQKLAQQVVAAWRDPSR